MPETSQSLGDRWIRPFAIVAAVLMLVFGFLPIVNWIPGGHDAPWYRARLDEWLAGTLIVVGVAVVLSILARRFGAPRVRPFTKVVAYASRHPARVGWLIGAAALATYTMVAKWVFSGVPLHLDELAQVIQARIFAQGRLYLDAPVHPEFISLLHVLDTGGKWYTQFPPGGPALLLPTVWLGVAWLSGPVLGALGVRLFWAIAVRTEVSMAQALGATLLFAFAPFVLFMSGSHMNHVGTLTFALLATWSIVRHVDGAETRFAGLSGFALGVMGMIRPVDAAAFSLPVAGLLFWRAARGRRREDILAVVAAGLGVSIPLALLGAYNVATTGSAFTFAYEVQWGREHGLGFHASPWGFAHTPLRGLELVSLYFLRLQTYLFESPVPSLVFPSVALLLIRRWALVDRLWLYSGVLLVFFYFMYWHDGFYLGPRFMYLLVPGLVLWGARLPALLRDRLSSRQAELSSLLGLALVGAVIMTVGVNLPLRFQQYRRGLEPMRKDVRVLAAARGVEGAVIFVRESWGAQILARLWAIGVYKNEAEALYRGVDTCELEEALTRAELGQQSRRWADLLADSAALVASTFSSDVTQRVLPNRAYSQRCLRRIAEDRAGFTILAPVLAKDWRGNIYARDLQEHNAKLLRDHPNRPVYLVRTAGAAAGAQLELVPLARDSLAAAWAAEIK